jgi:hypothetical protein
MKKAIFLFLVISHYFQSNAQTEQQKRRPSEEDDAGRKKGQMTQVTLL